MISDEIVDIGLYEKQRGANLVDVRAKLLQSVNVAIMIECLCTAPPKDLLYGSCL